MSGALHSGMCAWLPRGDSPAVGGRGAVREELQEAEPRSGSTEVLPGRSRGWGSSIAGETGSRREGGLM